MFDKVLGCYTFDFTTSGFTLVNREGVSLYATAFPYFEKVISHLVWIFFWITLILVSHFLVSSAMLYYVDRVLMTLVFLHLFLFGCRLTALLLQSGLKPILFPPLWVKITRRLQKGEGMELLKKYNLHKHSGLLTNLSLIQHSKGQQLESLQTLSMALKYAPNEPLLFQLFQALNQKTY